MNIVTLFQENKTVFKNFLTSAIGSIFLRGLTGITALLALRIFTPAEFGLLSLINQFIMIVPIFLNLGLRQAFWIEYFHLNAIARRSLINHIFIIYLVVTIPLLTFLFFHMDLINHYFFFEKATNAMIIVALIYSFIQFFSELYLQVLRNQMRVLLLTALQIGAAAFSIALNLVLVFYLRLGIIGVISANTLGIMMVSLYGFYHYLACKTECYITVKKLGANAKYLLILGFPFIPNILFSWLLAYGDRWLLAYFTDMDHVGIYALADMAGQLFNMCILYPLNASYVPYMLNQFVKHQNNLVAIEQQNRKNMKWAMILMSSLITLATALAWFVGPYLLPIKFQQSLNYIWFILIGYVFFMGTYFSSSYLVYRKKTWLLLSMNIIAASTNIALNIILIPPFKIYGCIIATVISYMLFFYLNLKEARYIFNKES